MFTSLADWISTNIVALYSRKVVLSSKVRGKRLFIIKLHEYDFKKMVGFFLITVC